MMMIAFREPKREAVKLTPKEKIQRLDIPGTVLFIGSIVCLYLALQWGGNTISWSNSKAWGLLLGFGLLLIAFVVRQFRLGDR